MKIYSDYLTEAVVRNAFAWARMAHGCDIYVEELRTWQPRQWTLGVEVWACSLNGKMASAHQPIGSYSRDGTPRAASWDDWGWVIARMYQLDPDARISWYLNSADFLMKVARWPRTGSDLPFLALDIPAPTRAAREPVRRRLPDPNNPSFAPVLTYYPSTPREADTFNWSDSSSNDANLAYTCGFTPVPPVKHKE